MWWEEGEGEEDGGRGGFKILAESCLLLKELNIIWWCGVNAVTGWPGVSILSLGEKKFSVLEI